MLRSNLSALLIGVSVVLASAGRAPPQRSVAVRVVAHLRLRELEAFEARVWRIATPRSGEYLEFLTRDEIRDAIGADDGTVAAAVAWLRGLGATRVEVSPLRDHVAALVPSESSESESSESLMMSAPEGVAFVAVARETTTTTTPKKNFQADDDATLLKQREKVTRRDELRSRAAAPYTVDAMKAALGIPTNLTSSATLTTQMVWGPGTFGYSETQLVAFKTEQVPLLNLSNVFFDTENHGTPGGDNYGEGNLDTQMTTAFGLNAKTLVSNTNTSSTTEEGDGFGEALVQFLTDLANRDTVPDVLSMSLGSLSAASCDALCDGVVGDQTNNFTDAQCRAYLQTQRQVCMYLSTEQTGKASVALQSLAARGVTAFAASGDGGSHFSFEAFDDSRGAPDADLAKALNDVSCAAQFPVFPTGSPFVVAVGGTQWIDDDPSRPRAWGDGVVGSGSGFSRQFDAPAHQQKAIQQYLQAMKETLPPGFNVNGRAYPDVAAVGVSGTSMSCPIVAGVFTLLIDQRKQRNLPPLGLVTPRLYGLYDDDDDDDNNLTDPPFDDVPVGSSNTSCDNGFQALPGAWDVLSGFGQPNWPNLLTHFGTDDPSLFVVAPEATS